MLRVFRWDLINEVRLTSNRSSNTVRLESFLEERSLPRCHSMDSCVSSARPVFLARHRRTLAAGALSARGMLMGAAEREISAIARQLPARFDRRKAFLAVFRRKLVRWTSIPTRKRFPCNFQSEISCFEIRNIFHRLAIASRWKFIGYPRDLSTSLGRQSIDSLDALQISFGEAVESVASFRCLGNAAVTE